MKVKKIADFIILTTPGVLVLVPIQPMKFPRLCLTALERKPVKILWWFHHDVR